MQAFQQEQRIHYLSGKETYSVIAKSLTKLHCQTLEERKIHWLIANLSIQVVI